MQDESALSAGQNAAQDIRNQSMDGGGWRLPSSVLSTQSAVPKQAKKSSKKRLHKRRSAHYKCAHEHSTLQYFTRGAGRARLGELAATRGNCPRFLARARHASCAGRESRSFWLCGACGDGERDCSSRFGRADRYAIAKRIDVPGPDDH